MLVDAKILTVEKRSVSVKQIWIARMVSQVIFLDKATQPTARTAALTGGAISTSTETIVSAGILGYDRVPVLTQYRMLSRILLVAKFLSKFRCLGAL